MKMKESNLASASVVAAGTLAVSMARAPHRSTLPVAGVGNGADYILTFGTQNTFSP